MPLKEFLEEVYEKLLQGFKKNNDLKGFEKEFIKDTLKEFLQ